jgi:hypothetical protein
MPPIAMPARTFQDSAGSIWEVFEVRRASKNPGAVSAGLEQGWLAFVKTGEKRRLAPFPPEWEDAGDSELERLCTRARVAVARPAESVLRPRIRGGDPEPVGRARAAEAVPITEVIAPDDAPAVPVPDVAEIDAVVRAFAHQARTLGMPAVDAMVKMKAMLLERFPGAAHPARDSRLVRRVFVDAYYFEREA